MTRTAAREAAFVLLFEASFSTEPDCAEILSIRKEYDEFEYDKYTEKVFSEVLSNKEHLDEIINKYSTSWKTSRLPRVSLCALRLAIYEIENIEDVPTATAINEAVELVKKFDGEDSAKYVNGVLGSYIRDNEK
ncbi:MAG: transcription antitermination factor NusB [Clostridiales bacterium]|nr:MAG: transcription antitermination factor NusB [Clostridiales bacterium]